MDSLFLRFPGFKRRAVTFSYDDGVVHDARLVSIFKRYGLKGTFNINSSRFGHEGNLTLDEMKELYRPNGQEVAAHGHEHFSLTQVPPALAVSDVLENVKALESSFATRIFGMAYANGSYDEKVEDILHSCGVRYCRTTKATHGFGIPEDFLAWHPTCHHDADDVFDLIDKFFAPSALEWYMWARSPRLLYIWGHSYEFDRNNNWEHIEKIAEAVSGKEDVWYATNGEIYEYVTAFRALEFSVTGYIHNPTSTDVYLDYFKKEILVKAGETVFTEVHA